MPIYEYECSFCQHCFEEFHNRSDGRCGKSFCPKCGNTSFKIPSVFALNIFKQRVFIDGTKTPENVRTLNQEKKWMKSQGITYDKPTTKEKKHRKEERRFKTETAMERAFAKANKKVNQGFVIKDLNKKELKKPKKIIFNA